MGLIADPLVDRVKAILEDRFPEAEVYVDRSDGAERINGPITWAGFEDMDHVDREEAVRAALKEELGPQKQAVSIILAYTPREVELMKYL